MLDTALSIVLLASTVSLWGVTEYATYDKHRCDRTSQLEMSDWANTSDLFCRTNVDNETVF